MNTEEILAELARRGVSLQWRDNRMTVTPKGRLDDTLRAQMLEKRAELEEWAKIHTGSLLDAVYATFRDLIDHVEDHVPETISRPCRNPRVHGDAWCGAFADSQMNCRPSEFAQKVKAGRKGCGDCEIAQVYHWLSTRRQKEEHRRQGKRAAFRANRFVLGAVHDKEEEED